MRRWTVEERLAWAMFRQGLSPNAKLMLVLMAYLADENHETTPYTTQFEALLGYKEERRRQHFVPALTELAELGLVHEILVRNDDGDLETGLFVRLNIGA